VKHVTHNLELFFHDAGAAICDVNDIVVFVGASGSDVPAPLESLV